DQIFRFQCSQYYSSTECARTSSTGICATNNVDRREGIEVKAVRATFRTTCTIKKVWNRNSVNAGQHPVLFQTPYVNASGFTIEIQARLKPAPKILEARNLIGFD